MDCGLPFRRLLPELVTRLAIAAQHLGVLFALPHELRLPDSFDVLFIDRHEQRLLQAPRLRARPNPKLRESAHALLAHNASRTISPRHTRPKLRRPRRFHQRTLPAATGGHRRSRVRRSTGRRRGPSRPLAAPSHSGPTPQTMAAVL